MWFKSFQVPQNFPLLLQIHIDEITQSKAWFFLPPKDVVATFTYDVASDIWTTTTFSNPSWAGIDCQHYIFHQETVWNLISRFFVPKNEGVLMVKIIGR